MHRRNISLFAGRRNVRRLSDTTEYWPLTLIPCKSRPRRGRPAWGMFAVLLALGAAMAVAYSQGVAAR
jgi:hypothetical protein